MNKLECLSVFVIGRSGVRLSPL